MEPADSADQICGEARIPLTPLWIRLAAVLPRRHRGHGAELRWQDRPSIGDEKIQITDRVVPGQLTDAQNTENKEDSTGKRVHEMKARAAAVCVCVCIEAVGSCPALTGLIRKIY